MYGMNYNQDGFNIDEDYCWNDTPPMGPVPLMNFDRNNRYGNAYGNYCGGYPPSGMARQYRPTGASYNSKPPLGWGGGQALHHPPMLRPPTEDKVTRFLLRCGIPKDNIQNIPRKLLLLFEPNYCGLCMQEFETFANARFHYLSKNHNKNERKWLSDGNDFKEIPLKARDLYCELCDIHITSKLHGESHYEGKAHRAIVEGRKEPKNKALLCRNMQARLQQLIRREKKFYKVNQEIAKPTHSKKIIVTELPPELFCKICNTMVTCTEQMTSHLNGKKHLNKEKHHILKSMRRPVNHNVKKSSAESTAENQEGKDAYTVPTAECAQGDNDNTDTIEVAENVDQEQNESDCGKGSESCEEITDNKD